MTSREAKADAKHRLLHVGITYQKLTARTVSFEGLGHGQAVFVEVYGANIPSAEHWKRATETIQKPSDGGYILKIR